VNYSLPLKTLLGCDGRYPTADEQAAVLNWAASVPKRLQAANLIAQKEAEIVREAIEQVRPRYQNFPAQHDRAWEKANRDMGLVLRYAVQGLIVDDEDMPQDKVLHWVSTIIRATGHTPALMHDCYSAVIAGCRRHLPPEAFALAEPYLTRMLRDMSSFPEPLKPAVN
jgi:hypothetical protein